METIILTLSSHLCCFLELAHYWGPELGPGTFTAWAATDWVGVGCGWQTRSCTYEALFASWMSQVVWVLKHLVTQF